MFANPGLVPAISCKYDLQWLALTAAGSRCDSCCSCGSYCSAAGCRTIQYQVQGRTGLEKVKLKMQMVKNKTGLNMIFTSKHSGVSRYDLYYRAMEVKVRYYREKRECILAAVSHPSLALQRRADCSCAVRGELQSRPHCGQPDVLLSDAHSATVMLQSLFCFGHHSILRSVYQDCKC